MNDWHRNNGGPPRTGDTPLRVKFRNGDLSKEVLPAAKWNWRDRDYAFDITHWSIET